MKLAICMVLGCCVAIASAMSLPEEEERQKREMDDESARKCMNKCPADVGCTIDDAGEAQCHFKSACESGLGPCPSTESSKNRRDADDDAAKCRKACPQDVGCRIEDNGEATCIYRSACDGGFGHCPPPSPPPPRNQRDTEMTPEQMNYCVQNCQDVGCVVNDKGNAECEEDGESIGEPPAPVPPQP